MGEGDGVQPADPRGGARRHGGGGGAPRRRRRRGAPRGARYQDGADQGVRAAPPPAVPAALLRLRRGDDAARRGDDARIAGDGRRPPRWRRRRGPRRQATLRRPTLPLPRVDSGGQRRDHALLPSALPAVRQQTPRRRHDAAPPGDVDVVVPAAGRDDPHPPRPRRRRVARHPADVLGDAAHEPRVPRRRRPRVVRTARRRWREYRPACEDERHDEGDEGDVGGRRVLRLRQNARAQDDDQYAVFFALATSRRRRCTSPPSAAMSRRARRCASARSAAAATSRS